MDFDPGDPWPDTSLVDDLLGQCTRGNTDPDTTSQGWVDREGTMLGAVEVGESNGTPLVGGPQPGNEFPVVCADYFGQYPRWMWFNWEPDTMTWPLQSAFIHPGGGGNPMHELLIFRLPRESVPA